METERKEPPPTIHIKDDFLEQIITGNKNLEVRPETDEFARIKPGDVITLRSSSKTIRVKIRSVSRFKSIDYTIQTIDLAKVGRGVTKENALQIWRKLYPDYSGGNILVFDFDLVKN